MKRFNSGKDKTVILEKPEIPRAYTHLTLLVVAAFVVLAAWFTATYNAVFDWTRGQRHALHPISAAVLAQAPDSLRVLVFVSSNDPRRRTLQNLLTRYQARKASMTVYFFNPDLYPAGMEEWGVAPQGEILLEYGQRRERTQVFTEQAISTAIYRLLQAQYQNIAFSKGHGERKPDATDSRGFNLFVARAAENGLNISEFDFTVARVIPPSITLLILASPEENFSDAHLQFLQAYVRDGGQLLWLQDPGALHGLEPLAHALGFSLLPGTVVDVSSVKLSRDPAVLYIEQFAPHPVVEGLNFLQLPHTAAIELNASQDWQNEVILNTPHGTWIELGDTGVPEQNPEREQSGPLVVAAGFYQDREKPITTTGTVNLSGAVEQRIIVIGDSDFLSNQYLHPNNLQFGLNLLNWFVNRDALLQWDEEDEESARISLTLTRYRRLQWLHLLLIPGSIIAVGLLLWRRRVRNE